MNGILYSDRKEFSAILEKTKEVAEKRLTHVDDLAPGVRVEDIHLQPLPERGIGAKASIDFFEKYFAGKMNASAGSRYFGFVTGGSTPASVAGDWLVSAFDQNAGGSNDSMAPQLEKQTIHFLKQLFGIDESYFGSFTSGATLSNFVGLALGRQWVGEQMNVDISNEGLDDLPKIKIVSGTPHSSIIKSMSMLGLGRKALVRIDTSPEREAVDVEKLECYLWENASLPVIVVANAGTVNTVDFDDLEAIGKLKSKYKFWLHVDAAFGGFAAASDRFAHLTKGINYADSITVDAHKWLNVPYDAAMQFTRHKDLQLKVFQNSAAYLGDPEKSPDFFHYTPENSRRFRALPAWFTLMAYGRDGHREIVDRNCDSAKLLGQLIEESSLFKLLAPVRMNVVCFTLNQESVSSSQIQIFLNKVAEEGKAFFTPTVYKNVPAIRAAVSNWQTEDKDIRISFESLIHAAAELKTEETLI
ncbi:MAG TPA: pyridoxal-dependent decarboxylase [Cyclobacteriaceae bacterium]|jgi:glutamate/tyrosine decarboxylase-like PLP-dependent enzyme|nr:pyridoxal-dependent decarboxylase [Cyclobacteriaceae bacterium]